jgi:predicted ABC-type ATPase
LLDRLVRSKRNIFFDHSAASRQHAILLQRVKEYGYRIEMHHIQCPLEEALERVRIRELICGRHTPEALVRERHELLLELLPIYRQTIDHSVSINTSSSVAVAQQHSAQSLGGFVP